MANFLKSRIDKQLNRMKDLKFIIESTSVETMPEEIEQDILYHGDDGEKECSREDIDVVIDEDDELDDDDIEELTSDDDSDYDD